MFNIIEKKIEFGGKTLTLQTGKIARQASSVVVKCGNATVLCTAAISSNESKGIDFVPLTVNMIEKSYASGSIPGGFIKRENRPSERATLMSRLIDRPIRPLFPSNYRNETQVICTLLSYDAEISLEVLCMIGASAALTISPAPFEGPLAATRVGYINGEYVLNPSDEQIKESLLDLSIAGTKDSVLMVESEAKELSEDIMLGAVKFGHEAWIPVIEMIEDLAKECAKEKLVPSTEDLSELENAISEFAYAGIKEAFDTIDKQARSKKLALLHEEVVEKFVTEEELANKVDAIFKKLEKKYVRTMLLEDGKRIDGRGPEDVRQIKAEIDVLPIVHGSALFTRGETQALVITTLGTPDDEQMIEDLDGSTHKDSFLLHYNFPPFATNDVKPLRAPGRREIGHGKLAFRAVNSFVPTKEKFPYTVRVVSEITESNGSSSMATVCGTSLSLMAAGVPIAKPISGIAMGLVKEGDKFAVLSDIMGDEDHLGDMDFKVAGSKDGITALQMDIKCKGVTQEIMTKALKQAHAGRMHILGKMAEAITESRKDISENAPKIESMTIPTSKIKDVIGSGGKTIRGIIEKTGAEINIEDDGSVSVSGATGAVVKEAIDIIKGIIYEPEVGDIVDGTVVKIIDAGAFVNLGGKDGFVHISELANYRIDFVDDVVNEGDKVKVKVIGVDTRSGRIKLSYRAIDQKTGEDISSEQKPSKSDSKKPAKEGKKEEKPKKKRRFF